MTEGKQSGKWQWPLPFTVKIFYICKFYRSIYGCVKVLLGPSQGPVSVRSPEAWTSLDSQWFGLWTWNVLSHISNGLSTCLEILFSCLGLFFYSQKWTFHTFFLLKRSVALSSTATSLIHSSLRKWKKSRQLASSFLYPTDPRPLSPPISLCLKSLLYQLRLISLPCGGEVYPIHSCLPQTSQILRSWLFPWASNLF